MSQNILESKNKWQLILQGLSDWSFWALYFGFYVLVNTYIYVSGSLCNLGLLKGLMCTSDPFLNGNWIGVTSIDQLLYFVLFLILFFLKAFLELVSKKKVESINNFDLCFRVLAILIIPFGMYDSFILISFLAIIIFLYKTARKAPVLNFYKQQMIVLLLFAVLGIIEDRYFEISYALYRTSDEKNYIDCCNNELIITNYSFKVAEPPICILDKRRVSLKDCRIAKPILRSLFPDYGSPFRDHGMPVGIDNGTN